MSRLLIGAVGVALCCQVAVSATSYAPVTFNDLAARADVIFVGQVADVHSFAMDVRGETVIKTRVTFSVSDPIFGTSSLVEVLDFLGGEWNGVGMRIAGMPTFAVGERRVVFARHDGSINPIVGFTQGLLRVERAADGIDRVFTFNGYPLARIESVGAASEPGAAPGIPMRLSELRVGVTRALTRAGKR
ncbi:MAG TPA: hypothetical protein VGJ78_13105 [Vicinamibacterales bacterium]|jgi:hypothetical protein